MLIDQDVYLEHFGVAGMKWGVRKDRSSSSGGSSVKKTKKPAKISTALDTGSNVGNALLYGPVGAVVIAKRSTYKGRQKPGNKKSNEKPTKEKTEKENKISTALDTGNNVANALLLGPVGAVVIAKRSKREGRR